MKVLIAGDYCPRSELNMIIAQRKFAQVFDAVRPFIEAADISIVNFETTVADKNAEPIRKYGPNLSSHPYSVEALKYAGFNTVTLANNHFYDYGKNGLETSMKQLDDAGIQHVGAGKNLQEAQRVLYLEHNDERLAVINCCEHEFSIADTDKGGCNPLNPVKQFYAIREASKKADHVIVIVHGGHEYYQLPSTRMQDTYRFFIDAGADAVINHHQHCYSGMEMYNGKPIFYGLGNFLFDSNDKAVAKTWHEGYMVMIGFEDDNINFQTIPYCQCDGEMTVKPLTDKLQLDKFYAEFSRLSGIIADRNRLEECQKDYFTQKSREKIGVLEPYRGRIMRGAYYRGWLPSFVRGEVVASMRNYIECEAHCDILKLALEKKMNNQ